MSDLVVVKAKIKDIACKVEPNFNVASDVSDVLNQKVIKMIEEGVSRAKANKRTTLMGKDI